MAPELLGVEDEGLQEQASMTGGVTCSSIPAIFAGSVILKRKDSNHCFKDFQGLSCRCVSEQAVCVRGRP